MLPTETDHTRRNRRLSWWLLVARLTSGRNQAEAGEAIGIVGSSCGDFERGVTVPSLRQLVELAALFEVPVSLFTEPPYSDEDRIDRHPERAGKPSRRTQLEVADDETAASG